MADNIRFPSPPYSTHAMVAPLGYARRFVQLPESHQAPAAPTGPAERPADTEAKSGTRRPPLRDSAFLGPGLQAQLRRVKSAICGRPVPGEQSRTADLAPPLPAGCGGEGDRILPKHYAPTPAALAALVGWHATKVHVPPGGVLVEVAEPEPALPALTPPTRHKQNKSIRRKPLPSGATVGVPRSVDASGAPAGGDSQDRGSQIAPLANAAPLPTSRRPALPYPPNDMTAAAVMPEPHAFRSAEPEPPALETPPPRPPKLPLEPLEPLQQAQEAPARPPKEPLEPPPRPPKVPL